MKDEITDIIKMIVMMDWSEDENSDYTIEQYIDDTVSNILNVIKKYKEQPK